MLVFVKARNRFDFSLLAGISGTASTVKALLSPGSSRQFCLGEIEASAAAFW